MAPSGPDEPGLTAALASLVGADVAAAVERAVDACLAEGDVRALAVALVEAVQAGGAAGAELWHSAPGGRGWRRVAAAGQAVPGADACAAGRAAGYPGRVAAAHAEGLALVFLGDHPGSDLRERLEDLAGTLLMLAAVLGPPSFEADGAPRPRATGQDWDKDCLD